MTHSLIRFLISSFVATCANAAYGQAITIKVSDEHSRGIYSRVYYDDGTQPRPFWNTDLNGAVQRPHACGKTRTLKAHPFDSGAFFDSNEEPCAPKVSLRVLERQTPKGTAINFKIVPLTLPDGSPGVITLKAALEATTQDVGKSRERPQCEAKFDIFADQQVYKVEGENWIPVKRGSSPFSRVFAGSIQPDSQTVILPYNCAATGGRLQTLQAGATDRINKSLAVGAVMKNETLHDLGVQ
jgi:hypothetical protein